MEEMEEKKTSLSPNDRMFPELSEEDELLIRYGPPLEELPEEIREVVRFARTYIHMME